ncbi:ABC transporter ATP-binding protein [Aeromonas hydrophila]|uniref:ABC transporter ATP-binding protein n=1 Tax=Aeromonas hydrophila TaxID=644 RepID=UPI002365D5B5|nr:ABC transporter ATP-binding protein [Aeromonas hydrophila]WDF92358.1 ABC transporter ATP-binding protein [Aeromonas hydrophila subsp. hydrophila]
MSSNNYVVEVKDLIKSYDVFSNPLHCLWNSLFPNFKKSTRQFHALNDVSFVINKGETVGIIGRNGSGKSTLLQLICGTLTPSNGSISVNGRIAALLELGSGFNPEFTGRENVYLNGAILGLSYAQMQDRFVEIEKFADIGNFIDQPIKTYSSGMVVRLAFATAIHVEPDILIVDEALAVGDTAFQQKCLNKIREMQSKGVSILLVTHSSNTLIEYCDRGIYLKSGSLIMDADCRSVVKKYADDLVESEGGHIDIVTVSKEATSDSKDGLNNNKELFCVEDVSIKNEFGCLTSNFNFGDEVTIQMKVNAPHEIEMPCFGVQISSVDGIVLWSTTTDAMALKVSQLSPGKHIVQWKLRANFSGNRYVLAIGIGSILNGEYKRSHRLEYAGHFDVMPQPHSGAGWLAPQPVFCIEK